MTAHVSYVGLLRAQAAPLPMADVLNAPIRNLSMEAHKARKARLYGHAPRAPGVSIPKSKPEPVVAPEAPPVAVEPVKSQPRYPAHLRAPLDMLQPPSWRFLIALASVKHGISEAEIRSESRARVVVKARDEAIALVYQHTQASTPLVGKRFNRDHTTILHSLQKTGADRKLVELLSSTLATIRPKRNPTPLELAWAAKTAKDEARLELVRAEYAKGTHIREIAKMAGVTYGTIKVLASRARLIHPRGPRAIELVPPEKREEYLLLAKRGVRPLRERLVQELGASA